MAEYSGSRKENDMDYVKDGTLTIQARTIKEVNSIDRVVVYADGCQREYLMPLPTIEGKWIPCKWYFGKDKKSWTDEVKCSECGELGEEEYSYCPYCGARMKGE